jgi:hypothetical protein
VGMRRFSRIGLVAGSAAAILLAVAPNASANWSSYISGWSPGHESRRWSDESYTELNFTNCTTGTSGQSTDVRLWRVVDNSPDVGYDTKHFTNCFNYIAGADSGPFTSKGTWSGLPYSADSYVDGEYKGGYYFRIEALGGDWWVCCLDAQKVTQDSTLAD